MGKTADYLEWADAVLIGSIAEVETPEPDADGVVSSGDDIRMTIAVDEVFKGEATAQVEVFTASGGASCGLVRLPEPGDPWLWFLYRTEQGAYAVNTCGGSGPAERRPVARVVELAGPGTPPAVPSAQGEEGDSPGEETGGVGGAAGTDQETRSGETDAQDQQGSSAVPWGVGGVALILGLALVGVFAVRRRAA